MPTRQQMWDRLNEPFDVLVIGGGVTGAGIARDAARRGLKVALVEMVDFAYGTSSRSSKLVHGGLRYLEQGEITLVFESVSERRILLDIAPHLVNPLGFLFPVYQDGKHPLWFINAGMWVYEGLALFRSPKRHRTLKREELLREEPLLDTTGITGAPLYFDCSTDDSRLTLENALDAALAGAAVVPRAKVVSLTRDDHGRLAGAVVEDRATGQLREIRAATVVNATGPWSDRTQALSKAVSASSAALRPTKGVHIVFDRTRLGIHNAVVLLHPRDRRVLFAIPWGSQAYVGTTDTDYSGDPADVHATLADVDYLLEASNHYFPSCRLAYDDVVGTWAGLRPLMKPVGAEVSESAVSREHQVLVGQDGLVTIAGGKLTTYRRMALEVVDTVVKLLRLGGRLPSDLQPAHTDQEPLPGAVGWPEDDDHDRVARRVQEEARDLLKPDSARLLADTYGMRALELARWVAQAPELAQPLIPGRPEILGQVDWSVKEELASEISDVLIRRTQLFFRHRSQGLDALDVVARRMQALLGWTDARLQASSAEFKEQVALAQRWRQELAETASP